MGLDACVYCDCYESGKVRTPPPQPELVFIDEKTGEVALRWDAPGADQHRFYAWLTSACEHGPNGELVSHYLGNIARIGFLRGLLENAPNQFPILLSKVLYSGTHAGDCLTLEDVGSLDAEMTSMRALQCADADEEKYLRTFEAQMTDLIQGARRVRKPIVF